MSVKVIVGLQWGDEGKGKIVDVYSSDVDLVVRYQGGTNAGHTVIIGNDKFIFHSIPSGILRKKLTCLISRGAVVDPEALLKEKDVLSEKGVVFKNRLFISKYAHVVFPYHKVLDELMDRKRKNNEIGTTKRGIGPCYADKYYRCGIRVEDLLKPKILRDKISFNLEIKNNMIKQVYKEKAFNAKDLCSQYEEYGKKLKQHISDCRDIVNRFLNKNILFEGAQGTLLGIDYGTYPFVTSSNPTAAGIFIAGSLPLNVDYESIGVFKAYTTRVGNGPFPSECEEKEAELLRNIGKEYGASTGRPRRCGWLDAFATRYSCRINGIDTLVLTKLDVLDSFEKIKLCVGYKYKDVLLEYFPASETILSEIEPVYEEYPGWNCSTKDVKDYDNLPQEAKNYIARIEEFFGKKIDMISIGSERSEVIKR